MSNQEIIILCVVITNFILPVTAYFIQRYKGHEIDEDTQFLYFASFFGGFLMFFVGAAAGLFLLINKVFKKAGDYVENLGESKREKVKIKLKIKELHKEIGESVMKGNDYDHKVNEIYRLKEKLNAKERN